LKQTFKKLLSIKEEGCGGGGDLLEGRFSLQQQQQQQNSFANLYSTGRDEIEVVSGKK